MPAHPPKTVAILSPGDMGAATGKMLRDGGIDVVTALEGRSALTRTRAAEAGIRDLPFDQLVSAADMVLSILVPAEARRIAQEVRDAMARTGARPAYVECNAIAPQTVREIEIEIRGAGAAFIDAGIIGSPPAPGRQSRFYCSGPDTAAFESLRACGLDIRFVGPEIGQASGLKMVYAASTKGTTALWTELLVAARAMGLDGQLKEEWGLDDPVAARNMRAIPSMPRRARRWIGEMEEIAATFDALGMTPRMLEGAGDMYRFIGSTPLANQTSREPDPSLDALLDALKDRLGE